MALIEVGVEEHPCIYIDQSWPNSEHLNFQTYGYPDEGGAVDLLTPARLTYRGKKGTEPAVFIDLASDTVKPGMSGGALLNVQSRGVCGIVVATRNPANPDGGLAVPWTSLGEYLNEIVEANHEFHSRDKRWAMAARRTEQPKHKPNVARRWSSPPCPSGFVGQDELISQVKKSLSLGKSVGLHGQGGVGKTTVAAYVANNFESKFAKVQWVPLGKTPNLGAREIVEQCAVILGEADADAYPPRLSTTPGDEELDEWRRFLSATARDHGLHLLVVIDDLWPGAVAEHIVNVLRFGAPSVMIVTGRDVELVAKNVPCGSLLEVSPLEEDAALRLLLNEIGNPQVPDKFYSDLRLLIRQTGGLPIAVVILAGLLRKKWWNRSEHVLSNLLTMLAHRRTLLEEKYVSGSSVRAVVEKSVDTLASDTRLVLAALSVLRPDPASFTEPVMVDLAATLAFDRPRGQKHLAERKERAEAALRTLSGASLLLRTPILPDHKKCTLRLHPIVADYAREYLIPESIQVMRLHQKAARYFGRIVSEPAGSSYSAQFRYEDLTWQDAAVNWIYHLGHESAVAARRALTTLYLDAFWWWGCFIPYPFCDELLDWWDRVEVSNRTRRDHDETGKVLHQFQAAYPMGLQKTSRGDWNVVRTALVRLRELLDVAENNGHSSCRNGTERRHLRAITDIFLAHTYRYGAAESAESRAEALEAADDYYKEAWQLIDQNNESWNRSWVLFEWAETKYERGLDGIDQMCDQAEPLAVKEGDPEVLAMLARLRGQLALDRGKLRQAFRMFGLAVIYAYAFHAIGPHGFPVAYNQALYDQLKSWVIDRVEELADDARQVACEALLAGWRNCWRPPNPLDIARLFAPGGRVELAATLWPPGPTDDELGPSGHRYAAQVRAIIKCIYANPPDGLLLVPLDLPQSSQIS